jgi:hypothetical protein
MRFHVILIDPETRWKTTLQETQNQSIAFQKANTLSYSRRESDGLFPGVYDEETERTWIWREKWRRTELPATDAGN